MNRRRLALVLGSLLVVLLLLAWHGSRVPGEAAAAPPPTVLSVTLLHPQTQSWPVQVPATGNVAAWQEASIGAESDGLRLTEVRVNVGDSVRKGQVLARFNPAPVEAERAEAGAAVALARAEADEAEVNHQRARTLDTAGVMSRQQVSQYRATALTTRARLEAAQAVAERARLRVLQTQVLAPADGVISARTATVGAVTPAGQELFRLITDGRLEWRAVVPGHALRQLQPGQRVRVQVSGAAAEEGRLRMLAPQIDTTTHSGMVYVDLPAGTALRAGAFAQGSVEVGEAAALSLPQAAVLMRDGAHYVMQVGQGGRVVTRKVRVGRLHADRLEIVEGLAAGDAVIASGLGLLNDGDRVQVLDPRADAGGGR